MRQPGSGERWVSGLVLAAGGSQRLGQAKQLLPYGGAPLLGHVLQTARGCPFDQLLCVVGGASEEVRRWVDLRGVEVVENAHYGDGCSSSIAAALEHVDDRCDVLVLMLGDQPGVNVATVEALLAGRGDAALAVCAYRDGRGHPLAFARSMFGELGDLHGDKGVWKLMDRHAEGLVEVAIDGTIPLDVDTWEDYRRVLLAAAHV
jgi:molybdenum cofactor cytidylyltransferase